MLASQAFDWQPLSLWAPPIPEELAVIFAVSSLSRPGLPGGLSNNTSHFVGYALLSTLLVRALAGGRVAGTPGGCCSWPFSAPRSTALTDEFHQSFVPGRTPDPADIAVDALGACAGAAMCRMLRLVAAAMKRRPFRVN